MMNESVQYVYGVKIGGVLLAGYYDGSQLFKQYAKDIEGMSEKQLDEKWEEFLYREGKHIFPMFYDTWYIVDEYFVIGFEVDSETFSDDGTLQAQIDEIFFDLVGRKPSTAAQVYVIETE